MRLLYFSPVPAGSYAQRSHFVVRAWLEWGVESVLWVNPYPCRLPQWHDLRRCRGLDEQAGPLDPRIRVLDVPALPIEPLPLGAWLNRRLLGHGAWAEIERFASGGADIPACSNSGGREGRQECLPHRGKQRELILGIGRPCALALAALRRLRPAVSFFDAMDNFPEFHRGLSRRAMRRHEDAVAAEVDLVVASSTFLADKFARRGLRVEKVLNACGISDECEMMNDECRLGHENRVHHSSFNIHHSPVLGYLGCIGRWFDWPLVIGLAEAAPEARIELVGPCVVPPPTRPPANVRLLPACRQSALVNHLSRFSAGLIPFRDNALTAGVDPMKYYDYRAAGLPVLSTRFGEMALRGRDDGVYFLDGAGGLAEAVSAALGHHDDDDETLRFRRNNNWTSRFSQSSGFRSLLPASGIRRAA
jgi:hypothetical protein